MTGAIAPTPWLRHQPVGEVDRSTPSGAPPHKDGASRQASCITQGWHSTLHCIHRGSLLYVEEHGVGCTACSSTTWWMRGDATT